MPRTRSPQRSPANIPKPSLAPQQRQQLQSGGLGQALVTGMAMGAGSEIAHQAIRGIMGNSNGSLAPQPAHQGQHNPCTGQTIQFSDCLEKNRQAIGVCQNFMDQLVQCRNDARGFSEI